MYCFGLTLVSERPHSWLEKLGNYSYALAVMVLPLYGGLYLSSLLADQVGQSHLAWAAPTVALGLGVAWFALSQLFAWLLRGRLGRQDDATKLEQLAKQEVTYVNDAQELFENEHYDMSVMEIWRAVEARLRRVLLSRGKAPRQANPEMLIRAAHRAGIISEPALRLLKELRQQWNIAISTEPLTKEAANAALSAARHILATIPVNDLALTAQAAISA